MKRMLKKVLRGFAELVESGSPLALACLMFMLAYAGPVVRFFAGTSVLTAVGALVLVEMIRAAEGLKKNPPADPDAAATLNQELGPLDHDMEEFMKEWKARK